MNSAERRRRKWEGATESRATIAPGKSTEAGLEAGGHDLRLRYHHTHIDGNTGWSVAEVDFSVRGKDGSVSPMHAFATSIWVRDGGAWKIKTQSIVNAPPAKQ